MSGSNQSTSSCSPNQDVGSPVYQNRPEVTSSSISRVTPSRAKVEWNTCLERMIFFSEPSLRRAVAEFIHHYHGERNHQGLGNALLEAEERVGSPHGKVRCRKRLGGLLSYYHRDAA